MEWLLLDYRPSTLFSLKSSYATSAVGKTLVLPSPYVVKMAFVNAGFRAGRGADFCADMVRRLATVELRIRPARESVVTQTIQRVRSPKEDKGKRETAKQPVGRPGKPVVYQSTVAYREMVWLRGHWTWAFRLDEGPRLAKDLLVLAPSVNWVGKRGSLVQFVGYSKADNIGSDFTCPVEGATAVQQAVSAHVAPLDDFGPDASFPALNSFDPKGELKIGKHRVIVPTIVPAGVTSTGHGFVRYSGIG
ncbi:MAG: hypothetical protein Q7T82_20995 [Armatimonadota bacterium]|nr:hypothetical protein [Armatimonadota bacterium]